MYPGAIPSYAGFTSSHTLAADNHAAQSNAGQADIIALATKVGTGASTPASGLVLRSSGAGVSAWGQVNQTTDVTGILPLANGGTGGASASSAATNLAAEVGKLLFPIGCVYTEITGVNPATSLGFGTWIAFGAGQTLVGVDAGQTEFNTVQKTGGEKTHTLLTAEMASHNHGQVSLTGSITMHNQALYTNIASVAGAFSSGQTNGNYAVPALTGAVNSVGVMNLDVSHTHTTNGSNTAHNNLQPYLTVYFWKRTA